VRLPTIRSPDAGGSGNSTPSCPPRVPPRWAMTVLVAQATDQSTPTDPSGSRVPTLTAWTETVMESLRVLIIRAPDPWYGSDLPRTVRANASAPGARSRSRLYGVADVPSWRLMATGSRNGAKVSR
jgi:hypothetical protein